MQMTLADYVTLFLGERAAQDITSPVTGEKIVSQWHTIDMYDCVNMMGHDVEAVPIMHRIEN